MKPVNIGLLGLGTVGGGTATVLQDNAAEISRRLGREVRISAVCDLSEEKAKQICPNAAFIKDPFELVQHQDVDVVVELFGGTGIAKDAVLKAIENGKHIVTANKNCWLNTAMKFFLWQKKKMSWYSLKLLLPAVSLLSRLCVKAWLRTKSAVLPVLLMVPATSFLLKCVKKAARLQTS